MDKILLLLPLLPFMDLVSTLFSLRYGGEEIGILARPMLLQHGPPALVVLAATASVLFFVFMGVVIRIKRTYTNSWKVGWMWCVLVIPIYWFFVLEGVYVSTVVMNFLVPFFPLLTQIVVVRAAIVGVYFVGIGTLTMRQMKQLPRF